MKRFLTAVWMAVALTVTHRAWAHVTIFVDHHDDMPLEKALKLESIVPLWAINGFLYKPGQVDYIAFTAKKGDEFHAFTVNPNKNGAKEFTPSFALIGPGLPAPTGAVPFIVPQADGAQVFTTPTDRGFSDEQFGYGALLETPEQVVTLPADGQYYAAVFDPQNKSGHYILSIGQSEDETLIPDIEKYTIPKFGDLNDDGQVNADDVQVLLDGVVGKVTLTSRQRFAADVSPVGDKGNQVSPGDGVVDVADSSRLLRRAMGLSTEDTWPF
jgi:hypothetical protein